MTDESRSHGGIAPNGHPRDADPTTNVLDLVAAAIQRQDDLRTADSKAIREAIVALEKHVMLRFTAIDHEFTLIESHRVEQKIDTKVAVDAALSAAEKAVKEQTLASEKSIIKSETSAAEQSKQQNATFTAAQKGVSDTLADVKDRVVKIESRLSGVREQEADRRGDQTVSHSGLMVIIGFLGLMLTVCVIAFSILAASGSFK